MTDWNMLSTGRDFSHWQGAIDWSREAAQKPAFVILKATDGMSVDPAFDRNRRAAMDHGLRVLAYPFLEPRDADDAIKHFLKTVGDKTIIPALDWEKSGVGSNIMERWIELCESYYGRQGLAYYGLYAPGIVSAKIANWPRWYPQYPGSDIAPPRLSPWDGKSTPRWASQWLIWQWSEKVHDLAVESLVDGDRLGISEVSFDSWYRTGKFNSAANESDMLPVYKTILQPLGRMLKLNSSGDDVVELQSALKDLGFNVDPDGEFGPQTEIVVELFQSRNGLTVDGKVWQMTWAKLGVLLGSL